MYKIIFLFLLLIGFVVPSFVFAENINSTFSYPTRSLFVEYNNNTGSVLRVNMRGRNDISAGGFGGFVGTTSPSTNLISICRTTAAGTNFSCTLDMLVPPGYYYRIDGSAGPVSELWVEQRLTSSTSTASSFTNTNQDYFNGVLLFFMLTWGVLFMFKRYNN